jgi:hypothetical protein
MFDIDRDQLRKTYQLCRVGFTLLALALVLACFTSLLDLFSKFEPGLVIGIQDSPWYQWLETPITWGCLLGAALLFGRWDHVSWQRRAGLLLIMSLVDLAIWFIKKGDALGVNVGDGGSDWLLATIGITLGWGEFALLSSLTCAYLVHLGVEHARDSDKSTRSMIATGAMVWLLLFCQRTNWAAGWPLQPRGLRGLDGRLLHHGFSLIWTIALIQVTALVISAARQSSYVLEDMDREDRENDPLRSRSDPPGTLERVGAGRDDAF